MWAVINKLFLGCLILTFSLGSMAADRYLWLEAESGAEFDPIVVKSDRGASQAIYLGSWKWADYSTRRSDAGKIAFELYIPEAGDYKLWARGRMPGNIRPFDISKNSDNVSDNSTWIRWQNTSPLTTWGWTDSGFTASFTAGMNTLYLIQREGGPQVHLDKILLTNNLTYVPTGAGGAELLPNVSNPFKADTVEKYGQLRVSGAQLRDKNNLPVQLQGISLHGLQWFPLVDNQTIPYSSEFFGAEAVRLAMYIEDYAPTDPSDYWGGYMADKAAMYQRVDVAIADAVAAGIYVLVDWHIHNTPGKYVTDAVDFFTYISQKYGHLPNIIYEICNEPVGVTWSGGIKPYANTVITAIRQNDPDNIIIVGTPNWSQDVDAAAQDPLNFSNIMYAFHFYAATHDINQMKNKVQTAINAGLPVFVSEWGSSDVGTSRSNFEVAKQWIEFMNQKGLSWINWSLGNKDEASSILKATSPLYGPWDENDLTEAGRWVKPYFDGSQSVSSTTQTPTPPAASAIPSAVLNAVGEINRVSLSWDINNINVKHYEIYRDTDSDPSGRVRIAMLTDRNYYDTAAAVGTTYYYWVKVIDVNNVATNSTTASASSKSAATSTTPSTTLSATGDINRVALNWSVNNINVKHFEIYRDTDSDPNGRARIAIVTERSYYDTAAIVGTTYYYWVKVIDINNIAFNSPTASATSKPATTSTTPNITLSAAADINRVALNWSVSNINVKHYELYRDTDSDPSGRTRIAILNERSFYDSTAAAGTTYYYWVKVIDTNNVATNSPLASAMPRNN